MQLKKRKCETLTDIRTVIMLASDSKYKSFPNHQRVKIAVFNSNYSWQERRAWLNRVIAWKGTRGENLEWQSVLHNSEAIATNMVRLKSETMLGDKNPAKGHGGRLSPFSDKFIGKTSKATAIANLKSTMKSNPGNVNTRIEYYLERGFDLDAAVKLLKERQAVGRLDRYVDRYGVDEGNRLWAERQDKWQKTLLSKSPKELARINSEKCSKGYCVSKAETRIFSHLSDYFIGIRKSVSLPYNDGANYYVYDIVLDNKIIEYNGDFWHANPMVYDEDFVNPVSKMSYSDIWKKELHKESVALESGYDFLRVWEYDFKNDEDEVIAECMNFLRQ